MTITAWRIVKAKHAANLWSGEGARLYGGRWNSPDVAVIYAADSRSLAQLECLVHLNSARLLDAYVMASITFEERLVTTLAVGNLPPNWDHEPPLTVSQVLGDEWVAGRKSAVLRVPSAVVSGECNFLINPQHPDFKKCKLGTPVPIKFDGRLLKS